MDFKGLRKWSIGMTIMGLSFFLALNGKLTGDFMTISVAIMGALTAGNAVEHMKAAAK